MERNSAFLESSGACSRVEPVSMGIVAVIGLAGRFPGARDTEELWQVVSDGRSGITHFSIEELLAEGVERDREVELFVGAGHIVPVAFHSSRRA